MRIQSIEVKNFKSLDDFRLDLAKFTCLIGLNGSGKSTVLQFIDFLSQLVRGDMEAWLEERHWKRSDLRSKLIPRKKNIEFCVRFVNEHDEPAGRWEATYSPFDNRCTSERIDLLDFLLETKRDEINIVNLLPKSRSKFKDRSIPLAFSYEGSVLSALKTELLPPSIMRCKELIGAIKSLELLSPAFLRQRTRESSGSLGLGGQRLASFLHEIGSSKRQELVRHLKKVYPQLMGLTAKSLRGGWKQIEISEQYEGSRIMGIDLGHLFKPGVAIVKRMTTEARHINDGMLRLMAILAELETENRFLLFDEIENGINPELVEFVVDKLTQARQQVMVTTHSPMILNYLDDDTARAGVMYLYKTPRGATKSIPFFSIPSLAEKLTVMGPGEAFVDTNLTQLAEEIASMTPEEA